MASYSYINSSEYINSLEFDYIETFSLQRGKEYESQLAKSRIEFEELNSYKKNGTQMAAGEEARFEMLNGLLNFTQYLLNGKGEFHPSSKKINTISPGDARIAQIKLILNIDAVDIPRYLCSPLYRDAIVFYGKGGEIISALNVCLSCKYMETQKFHHINGDVKVYDQFKRLFIDLGHDIEN